MLYILFTYYLFISNIVHVFAQFDTYSTMDRGYCIGSVDHIQLKIATTSAVDCWNNCLGLVNSGGMPSLVTAEW